jgi:16S rRNA A1518/A1519 N6-dimethyltransferase RsmA/KsgA/DIM1 with predicted DNA glycosylase/AP lyase activity
VRREPDYDLDDFDTFEKVVRSIFTHRRKKIRNCIKLSFPDIDVKGLNYMDLRAEILKPSEIAELSNSIFKLKSK